MHVWRDIAGAFELPNSPSVVSIFPLLFLLHIFCNVLHWAYSMNFELRKGRLYATGRSYSVLEELDFDAVEVTKTLSVRGSRAEIRGSFCAKTTVNI